VSCGAARDRAIALSARRATWAPDFARGPLRADAREVGRVEVARAQGAIVTLVSWSPFVAVCAIALGRALLVSPSPESPAADDATRRAAFADIAAHEAEMRQVAAKDFPTDPWSQDDSFHEQERRRARDFANARHVRFTDVLDGIDEGLRARAAGQEKTIATVPPCHPRAIY
jgi:hypothetical protein